MTIILESMEQGSREWLEARIGCITMSNADKLLVGGQGKTRRSYIIDVASEMITGMPAEQINVWAMQRGTLLEPFARQAYEARTGAEVRQVGLGYLNEDRRISSSPDGIRPDRGIEIKCQGAKAHMRTLIEAKNPKKFAPQMQGGMWVFGFDQWDYVSFCPEFAAQPLFIMTVTRDDEMIKRIEESAINAVEEVDAFIKSVTGETIQAVSDICDKAIEMIDIMQNREPEIY